MEQFAQPVEGLSDGLETAAKPGSLQLLELRWKAAVRTVVAHRQKSASCSEGGRLAKAGKTRCTVRLNAPRPSHFVVS